MKTEFFLLLSPQKKKILKKKNKERDNFSHFMLFCLIEKRRYELSVIHLVSSVLQFIKQK